MKKDEREREEKKKRTEIPSHSNGLFSEAKCMSKFVQPFYQIQNKILQTVIVAVWCARSMAAWSICESTVYSFKHCVGSSRKSCKIFLC